MAGIPFGSLVPQRSRVLPQGGLVLGQLTGRFAQGLSEGRALAQDDEAARLMADYALTPQGGAQPVLGNLIAPTGGATTSPEVAASTGFNGIPTRENAAAQDAAWASIAGYGNGLNTTGLDPVFGQGLDGAINAYLAQGGDSSAIQINSLVRSQAEQAELYRQYQAGQIGLAAPPGSSRHEYGAAADIQSGPFLDWLHANAGAHGLSFLTGDAFTNDPGHVQLQGPSPAGTRAPAIAASGATTAQYPGGWQPPSEQEKLLLRAMIVNPATRDMAYQEALRRMTPPVMAEPDPVVINGQLVDRNTGQIIGDYRDPQAAAGAGFRPLVDPAERAAMGIPATDQSFYQIGPDGRVYRESGGGQTINVAGTTDVGTIPQGYRLVYDDQGRPSHMEPIPGGPAAIEAERAASVANAAGANADRQTSVLLTNLDGARQLAEQSFTTGFTGALAAAVPGTPAYDLRAKVDTIKAIIGFQTLQEMRNASPTGGALGQITERELAFLQATWGSLDPNQSYNAFVQQLENARQITIDIVEGRRTVDEGGNLIQRTPNGGTAPDGTVVQLPDGTLQIKQNGQWVPYAR